MLCTSQAPDRCFIFDLANDYWYWRLSSVKNMRIVLFPNLPSN